MKPFRMFLHAVLALMLLVQGAAASVAGATLPQAGSQAAAMGDVPCHDADPAGAGSPSCCDASCPDMVTCAGANLALAAAAPAAAPKSADGFRLAHADVSLPAPRATFLLKPPIALHG
jgi:hypothetical protein